MLSKLLQAILNILSHTHDVGTGKKGFLAIADTDAHVGNFYAVLAVNGTATLDAAGTVSREGGTIIDNHVIPDGFIVYGNFSSVQLAAGNCYAYYE